MNTTVAVVVLVPVSRLLRDLQGATTFPQQVSPRSNAPLPRTKASPRGPCACSPLPPPFPSGIMGFYEQINMAASFRPDLVRVMGIIMAKDTKAAGVQWLFGPVLDLNSQVGIVGMPLMTWCGIQTLCRDSVLSRELAMRIGSPGAAYKSCVLKQNRDPSSQHQLSGQDDDHQIILVVIVM
jgi:hypothetical protein